MVYIIVKSSKQKSSGKKLHIIFNNVSEEMDRMDKMVRTNNFKKKEKQINTVRMSIFPIVIFQKGLMNFISKWGEKTILKG